MLRTADAACPRKPRHPKAVPLTKQDWHTRHCNDSTLLLYVCSLSHATLPAPAKKRGKKHAKPSKVLH
jgi:hypothetical protein